jgi:hypothetical protein
VSNISVFFLLEIHLPNAFIVRALALWSEQWIGMRKVAGSSPSSSSKLWTICSGLLLTEFSSVRGSSMWANCRSLFVVLPRLQGKARQTLISQSTTEKFFSQWIKAKLINAHTLFYQRLELPNRPGGHYTNSKDLFIHFICVSLFVVNVKRWKKGFAADARFWYKQLFFFLLGPSQVIHQVPVWVD